MWFCVLMMPFSHSTQQCLASSSSFLSKLSRKLLKAKSKVSCQANSIVRGNVQRTHNIELLIKLDSERCEASRVVLDPFDGNLGEREGFLGSQSKFGASRVILPFCFLETSITLACEIPETIQSRITRILSDVKPMCYGVDVLGSVSICNCLEMKIETFSVSQQAEDSSER